MFEEVDIKYRIPLQGKYWKGINSCPHCGFYPDSVTGEIIGFADSDIGLMVICECPKCFKKWRFHARDSYKYFKLWIQNGWQKHFKGTEGDPEVIPKIITPGRR
jgi:hypothetical protein